MARPSFEITDEMLERIGKCAGRGLTVEQIAYLIGCGPTTFYKIQKADPRIKEVMEQGRADALEAVTNALYEKAIKGDNTAMIFFLKNRSARSWLDSPAPEAPKTPEKVKIEVSLYDPDNKD